MAGRLGQGRQEGDFRDGQLVQRLAEIIQRRGAHAIAVLAQIDLIEIQLEDLLLGIGGVDADGQDRLAHLARHLEVGIEQEAPRHLLGDGGGALRTAPFQHQADILDRGAQDAGGIDAGMVVEIAVLGGGEGLLHQLGDEGGGHEDAPLMGKLAQHRAVAGIDPGGDGRLVILQRFHAGQIARQGDQPEGRKADRHHQQRRRRQAKPSQKTGEESLHGNAVFIKVRGWGCQRRVVEV